MGDAGGVALVDDEEEWTCWFIDVDPVIFVPGAVDRARRAIHAGPVVDRGEIEGRGGWGLESRPTGGEKKRGQEAAKSERKEF